MGTLLLQVQDLWHPLQPISKFLSYILGCFQALKLIEGYIMNLSEFIACVRIGQNFLFLVIAIHQNIIQTKDLYVEFSFFFRNKFNNPSLQP